MCNRFKQAVAIVTRCPSLKLCWPRFVLFSTKKQNKTERLSDTGCVRSLLSQTRVDRDRNVQPEPRSTPGPAVSSFSPLSHLTCSMPPCSTEQSKCLRKQSQHMIQISLHCFLFTEIQIGVGVAFERSQRAKAVIH